MKYLILTSLIFLATLFNSSAATFTPATTGVSFGKVNTGSLIVNGNYFVYGTDPYFFFADQSGGTNTGIILEAPATVNTTYRIVLPDEPVSGKTRVVSTVSGSTVTLAFEAIPVEIGVAASDQTTAITTGTGKVTFRFPKSFTLTEIRASLVTAQTSGNIFTVDVNKDGTSILSTKLTIDNTEESTHDATGTHQAATAAVISDTAMVKNAKMTIDVDQIGDGTAKGLMLWFIGRE